MSVQSVKRAFEVLEILGNSNSPIGVSEVATRSKLPLATVHRLLDTLTQIGYVEKDLETHLYTLGVRFLHLRGAIIDYVRLAAQSMPVMKRLVHKLDETVHLAVLSEGQIVYIERVEGFGTHSMYTRIGKRNYVHCTALGKAMVAYQTESCVQEIISKHGLPRFSANTITSPERFMAELQITRDRGYAIDDYETEEPVRCIAAPIKDYDGQVIAAISTSGPMTRITPSRDPEISLAVCNAAHRISGAMGYINFD